MPSQTVTVVGGAGHVGIPLVLSFAAKGFTVNVNDINLSALHQLAQGELPFKEVGGEALLKRALAEKRLVFTADPGPIFLGSPVIITIGTPVDEFLNPVRRVILECVDALLPYVMDGQLLVLRSTLYPGTTEEVDRHIKRKGRKLLVAYCPERVVQGHGIEELASMPQIVSGVGSEAIKRAHELFIHICPETVTLSPMEAEFAKLFANAYRYITFGATNQFYTIAKQAGLDYHNILVAMKHSYPRAKDMPGPGLAAGPCLVKDTMQLLAFARNEFSLGNAAIMVNEGLPLQIVQDLRKSLPLDQISVGLLGMAFKANSDDPRASLSYKIKKALTGVAKEVLTTDPHVKSDPELLPLDEVIGRSNVLILCAPHDEYLVPEVQARLNRRFVYDVWGALKAPSF